MNQENSGVQTSCIYRGRVMHRRLIPFGHRFVYRVFSLLLEIDDIPRLARRLRCFSHNRFNLFSFHDRDHGAKDGSALRPWIEAQLAEAGIDLDGGPVKLLCFPRILGYVFNPLSVWYCYRRSGELAAVLYEVRNTFGDWHNYLIPVPFGWSPERPLTQGCAKRFHVSPFIGLEGRYSFRLLEPGERLSLAIRLLVSAGEQLVAVQSGHRHSLNDRELLRAFFSYPLMTLKVIMAIHWEALQLWRKGARFHRRPKPPARALSVEPAPAPEAAE